MKTEKVKTDLFRFATLRAPQLISKERRKLGFVEHPNPKKSVFLSQINPNEDDAIVRNKLLAAANTFHPFDSVDEIKSFAGDLWLFSVWLGKNKNNLEDLSRLDSHLLNVVAPSLADQARIWDNVFYDILLKKNPHVRQGCLQLLVTIHFLENNLAKRSVVKDLQRIAKSRVVIPSVFSRRFANTSVAGAGNKAKSSFQQRRTIGAETKKQAELLKGFLANETVKELLVIRQELKTLYADYTADYKESYKKAVSAHEAKVSGQIAEYKKSKGIKSNIINSELSNEEQLLLENTVDSFVFEFPKPLSPEYIGRRLSFETKYLLQEMDMLNGDLSDALIRLDEKIAAEEKLATTKRSVYPKSILYKGIKLKTSQTYIPSYAISSRVTTTASGYDVKVYFSFNAGYSNARFETADFQVKIGNETSKPYKVSMKELAPISTDNSESLFVLLKSVSIAKKDFQKDFSIQAEGKFSLDNGNTYAFSARKAYADEIVYEVAEELEPTMDYNDVEIKHYGISKIGIADYRRVEQELCCYIPGEVSQIENIMAREYREKATRSLVRSEDTYETTSENEVENQTDTTSTARNEMNSEIAHVLQTDRNMGLGFSTGVSGEYLGVKYDANVNGDFSFANSSSDSDTVAKTYAEDVTRRALERVVQKNTVKRTSTILREFEENNKHGYDNREGDHHVTGVFRWINKVYKNQLVNYGKRLIYEFMLPEPARYYKELIVLDMEEDNTSPNTGPLLVEPIDPKTRNILGPDSITRANYQTLAGYYGVNAAVPLDATLIISESYNRTAQDPEGTDDSATLQPGLMVPTDYVCNKVEGDLSFRWRNRSQPGSFIEITAGGHFSKVMPGPSWDYWNIAQGHETFVFNGLSNTGTISVTSRSRKVWSFTLQLRGTCSLKASVYQQWQQTIYNAIIAAYNQQMAAYNQALAANAANEDLEPQEVQILKTNPLYNKQFILNELKRLCIEMMLAPFNGQQGKGFYHDLVLSCGEIPQYTLGADLDAYARQVKFFEQAFDWTILSHIFYPYYWAEKCKWKSLFQSQDSVDYILQEFLQSGMARLLVPVREGFEDAVVYFMETGEIWHGTGIVLDTDDELYLSIIDETTILDGEVEDTWETIVPTALTIIQGKSAYLEDEGLPCCEDEEEKPFSSSDNILELLKDK